MVKKIVTLFMVVVMLVSLTACGSKQGSTDKTGDGKTIKIAYLPITHSLAVLAEADELQEKDGIKIELIKYGSWPELLDALNSGKVDGASVLIELAMKSKQEGVGIKAVALGHKDGNVLIVSNKIKDVSDLKGKTFAIPHRQSSHNILLNDALAKGKLTTDDINVTELAPTEMPSALVTVWQNLSGRWAYPLVLARCYIHRRNSGKILSAADWCLLILLSKPIRMKQKVLCKVTKRRVQDWTRKKRKKWRKST